MLLALGALILASSLAFFYLKKQGFDELEYVEHIALLRHLRQLDAQLELDVLKSRIGLATHYDHINQTQAELIRLLEELDLQMQETAGGSVSVDLPDHSALLRAVRDKAALIEQFKSDNSRLNDSLGLLHTAAAQTQRSLSAIADRDADRSAARVGELLLASVLFSQAVSTERSDEILAGLVRLKSGRSALPADTQAHLMNFGAHVRAVLNEQPVVNQLLRDISAVPTAVHVDEIHDALSSALSQASDQNRRHGSQVLMFSAVLMSMLLFAAVKVARSQEEIRSVNKQLHKANENLEQRVRERTRELDATQSQLVAAARLAGMAEIATNVLHNVGNVLNAINISAGLVIRQLRSSKLKGLARSTALIDQHQDDLGDFLTRDAKGKLLPAYLRELAQTLAGEQELISAELATLQKSIDHIKHVIATQQSYAGVKSLKEMIRLGDIVADAIQINSATLSRHNVSVSNEVPALPALPLDRNRVLMILVNLMINSKQAMRDIPENQSRITLGATLDEHKVLRISVADNGEGIPAENLKRVFAHGFTTRESGHGFGLHSCVLAAREMGGQLRVHSAGPGQGACFTLEIPTESGASAHGHRTQSTHSTDRRHAGDPSGLPQDSGSDHDRE